MTYPPQGGYPDDPTSNAPDPHSPFGYPDQPAPSPEPPAQYTQPPAANGWPDAPQYPDSPPTPPPGALPPPQPQPPMGGYAPAPPPPGMGGFPPQQPSSPPPSGNSAIGWVIGGIIAVVLVIGGIGAVFLITNDDDSGGGGNSATESQQPSKSPTDVVNAYYDAVRAHDVNGAYKTLCAKMQGSEDQFFGTYDEQQFWDTVDASTYTVGSETKKDDSNARVDIKQEIQGENYDFYADLVLEEEEWKICYWGTPT